MIFFSEFCIERIIMAGMGPGLVQYVVVRQDLFTCLAWPLGAVVAQACHATAAVTHLFHNDDNMKTYLADLDNMHKVGTSYSYCSV